MLRTWSITLHQSESSNFSSDADAGADAPGAEPDVDAPVSLADIGWNELRAEQFAPDAAAGLSPGRVARVDGRSVLLITESGTTRAEGSTTLVQESETADGLPAAGDWVGFRPRPSHDTDVIEAILPRSSRLVRPRIDRSSFRRAEAVGLQVVAANLDTAFVVHAANNVNPRRLEREAAQVASSGADVVIVLNKADLVEDVTDLVEDARMSVPFIPIHSVSGATGEGVDALAEYARPDRTVAFIGASGVGKSTLTNRLLGQEVMETGEVREDDQRGRHTTTARHLIPIPGGGALIDTPGIRSLGLTGADEGVAAVFDDITELAANCRFNDCSHSGEPGCAVMEAIFQGEMSEDRLGSFRKLTRELEFMQSKTDVRLRHAKRDMLKARTKRGRQMMRARKKFGRSG